MCYRLTGQCEAPPSSLPSRAAALWSDNGRHSGSSSTVIALLHNEYHGWEHDEASGCNATNKQNSGPTSCSWNSISLARR